MAEENLLLTEEFMEFAAKIKEIHEKKKIKKAELKKFYDSIQADIKALDAQAKEAEEKFEMWKKQTSESGKDKSNE